MCSKVLRLKAPPISQEISHSGCSCRLAAEVITEDERRTKHIPRVAMLEHILPSVSPSYKTRTSDIEGYTKGFTSHALPCVPATTRVTSIENDSVIGLVQSLIRCSSAPRAHSPADLPARFVFPGPATTPHSNPEGSSSDEMRSHKQLLLGSHIRSFNACLPHDLTQKILILGCSSSTCNIPCLRLLTSGDRCAAV